MDKKTYEALKVVVDHASHYRAWPDAPIVEAIKQVESWMEEVEKEIDD